MKKLDEIKYVVEKVYVKFKLKILFVEKVSLIEKIDIFDDIEVEVVFFIYEILLVVLFKFVVDKKEILFFVFFNCEVDFII